MIRRARSKGIPLYYQVMRSLKEDILSGRFAPEDRLPSEAELTQIFKVSRVVVRQALQILEDEGLIVRIKGKGTFVAKDAVVDESPVLSGYIEDFLRVGLSTKAKVLHFGLVRASPDLASVFKVDEGTDLFYVKRLRMVEGRPFSVIENYLPYGVGILIPLALIEDEPLMQLIETRAGIPIDWASQVFQAVSADSDLAHSARHRPHGPCPQDDSLGAYGRKSGGEPRQRLLSLRPLQPPRFSAPAPDERLSRLDSGRAHPFDRSLDRST